MIKSVAVNDVCVCSCIIYIGKYIMFMFMFMLNTLHYIGEPITLHDDQPRNDFTL